MADELRAATERLRKNEYLYRKGKDGRMEADREIVADAYLDEHLADDGTAVDEAWLRAVGMADQWYDDTWGTPLHSSSPIGIAVQTNGRAMVRLGTTVSYLGDVVLPTRGHVRRLALALGVELPAAATDGPAAE